MTEKHFVYINAKARISQYSIVDVSQSEKYIQGICLASRSIKTFIKDRILQEFPSAYEALKAVDNFRAEDCTHLVNPKK
ncbi:MAG: hypothetical protein ACRC24_08115 [Vibrionaceae bacterium]